MRTLRDRTSDENGQGVIEFAIIAMVLLLILAGIVDYSRFMYYQNAINNAARDAVVLAIEPCADADVCGQQKVTTDDFIVQAAYCAAQPYAALQPSTTCGTCITSLCTSGSPCTACLGSIQDICVQRGATVSDAESAACSQYYAGTTSVSGETAPATGQVVVVNVGYDFVPVTPVIRPFFPSKTCWPSDTTAHTLCVRIVARTFS